ncbi:uncharacterized protein LOC144904744 [Branchiostoma floridae x Branchiostoma belcheri]
MSRPATSITPTQPSIGCPDGYVYHQHSRLCYKAFDDAAAYVGAVARCSLDGGTLAMPRDTATNEFLIELKNAVDNNAWFRFGLTDVQQEGVWMWVDNVPLGDFTAWGPGEPNSYNNIDEDCVEYFPESHRYSNTWNDGPCTTTNRKFICQFSPSDPCSPSVYRVLNQAWRNVNQRATSPYHCDSRFNGEWYRFMGPAGTQMPTQRPATTHVCGTYGPMWMNGAHPAVADGEVSRRACAYWRGNACYLETTIQMKACRAGYYVYKLPSTRNCNYAYCGETGVPFSVLFPLPPSSGRMLYFHWLKKFVLKYMNLINNGLQLQSLSAGLAGQRLSWLVQPILALQALPQNRQHFPKEAAALPILTFISSSKEWVLVITDPSFQDSDISFHSRVADPCSPSVYRVLNQAWRNVNQRATSPYHCDSRFNGEWYRFMGPAGTQMPTQRPATTHVCGTHVPMWMNGAHPTVADGEVSRQACAYWTGNPCILSRTIQVKACSAGYYVYKLPSPPGCHYAYCGETV